MRGFLDWRDATPNDLDVQRPRGFAHCLAESRFGHQLGAISDLVPSGPSAQAVVEVGGGRSGQAALASPPDPATTYVGVDDARSCADFDPCPFSALGENRRHSRMSASPPRATEAIPAGCLRKMKR